MKILFCFFTVCMFFSNICSAGKTNFSEEDKVRLANLGLKESYLIEDIPAATIKQLLLNEKFDELEKIFHELEREYKSDIKYELKAIHAFEVFSELAPDAGDKENPQIEKWISRKNSYISHCANEYYYYGLSSEARGDEYIDKVSKKRLSKAQFFWDKSIASFKKAISLNKNFLPAYNGMLWVGAASGNRDLTQKSINEALLRNPEAYFIRANYIMLLQPKWGISYDVADSFINEAQKYGEKNPRLWSLRGYTPAMQAYEYLLQGNMKMSLIKYQEALKYGDKPVWIRSKAYVQYTLKDDQGAIESMKILLKYINDANEIASINNVIETLRNTNKSDQDRSLSWYSFQ